MKRMLTLSLGAVMVAAVTPVFGQAFPDTPENHWAYQAVAGAKAAGFLVGYPDGFFRGPRPASRYEMAAALYALYTNLKGVSDGLAAQLDAINRKISAPDLSGFATKQELKELADALAATKAAVAGMKSWGDDIAALKRMTTTFEKELASQGVDIEALKKGVTDLDNRVKALEGRKMPVNISGDINVWLGAGYSTDDEYGITVDGRPTGAERAGNTPTGISHDLSVGHEAAMTLTGTNDTGPKWTATFVTGNLFEGGGGFDQGGGLLFGNQGHVWDGVPFQEGSQNFYVQNLVISMATSLFGQDFNARMGRVSFQAGPYFFQRPDGTPYFSNERWDDGNWRFDGAIFDFHFGSSTFTLQGGRDSSLTDSSGMPLQFMSAGSAGHIFDPETGGMTERPRGFGDHNTIWVDQHLGAHLNLPLGKKGGVNLAYMIFDENSTTNIGSSVFVNRAIVFGGDVNYMFGEKLSFNAGYSQSNMNLDSKTVIDSDNAAYWAGLKYKTDKWSFHAGYRSIDPQFWAPGSWGRIGIWWNPTDIQGFNVGAMFQINDRMSFGASGQFNTGREISLDGVAGLTKDDKVNSFKAHLNYKVNESWDLMIGGEFVNWDLASRDDFTGGKPEERWYNFGLKYHMGENAFWNFLWQVSDYDSKGVSGFNPFGWSSSNFAKGGFITTQIGIKY